MTEDNNFVKMKKILSVTIEEDLFKWLQSYSQTNFKFRNKSHVVEVALEKLKEEEEKAKKKKGKN